LFRIVVDPGYFWPREKWCRPANPTEEAEIAAIGIWIQKRLLEEIFEEAKDADGKTVKRESGRVNFLDAQVSLKACYVKRCQRLLDFYREIEGKNQPVGQGLATVYVGPFAQLQRALDGELPMKAEDCDDPPAEVKGEKHGNAD
jgi:hypothetical protein